MRQMTAPANARSRVMEFLAAFRAAPNDADIGYWPLSTPSESQWPLLNLTVAPYDLYPIMGSA